MQPFNEPIYVTRPLLADIDKVKAKIAKVWQSQWLTNNGHQHHLLEVKLVSELKVPHLSLINNGTIALMIALRSLNLTSEVITTPFTFPATIHALEWCGIRPVFCDIESDTMNIDADKIEALINPATKAILGVHVFGTPCNVSKIQQIADKHGLKVIYDAAHAFSCEIGNKGIGSFGDISMFSFHATKLFHTLEGGALTYNDPSLKEDINLLKNFGIKNEDEVVGSGINGKMNELQAAIGLINLDCLEEERTKRASVVARYKEKLRDVFGISFYENPANIRDSYQYFVIRINEKQFGESRDQVYLRLRKYNVFARKYFSPLCSSIPCYSSYPTAAPNRLPVATRVVTEVLSLPLYGALMLADVEKICDLITLREGKRCHV